MQDAALVDLPDPAPYDDVPEVDERLPVATDGTLPPVPVVPHPRDERMEVAELRRAADAAQARVDALEREVAEARRPKEVSAWREHAHAAQHRIDELERQVLDLTRRHQEAEMGKKLAESKVKEIEKRLHAGETYVAIAERGLAGRSAIERIAKQIGVAPGRGGRRSGAGSAARSSGPAAALAEPTSSAPPDDDDDSHWAGQRAEPVVADDEPDLPETQRLMDEIADLRDELLEALRENARLRRALS